MNPWQHLVCLIRHRIEIAFQPLMLHFHWFLLPLAISITLQDLSCKPQRAFLIQFFSQAHLSEQFISISTKLIIPHNRLLFLSVYPTFWHVLRLLQPTNQVTPPFPKKANGLLKDRSPVIISLHAAEKFCFTVVWSLHSSLPAAHSGF